MMSPEELKEALDKCVHCGRCLSVCPVYKKTCWEGSAARGKLALLEAELSGRADLGRRMKDLLSHCLLCGACAEVCANSVGGDELIREGRNLALKGGGLTRLTGLLARDLLSGGITARGLHKTQGLFLESIPRDSGLHFRFPLPGLHKERRLPRPADRPFLSGIDRPAPGPGSGPRVALFVGCVANYLRPAAAQAAVRLLEAAGARVFVPPDQVCCGKPAAGAGDEETTRFLAKKNLAAFNPREFDFVATYCATCSEQIKEYENKDLTDRVMDISQLLTGELKIKAPAEREAEPLKVFYHDPCHLRRKQGIYKEPRQLIESLPGVELVGGDAAPVCCGYGGIFNLWHYGLSRDLFKTRAESIAPWKPDLVVTSCSGCWLQFEDGLQTLNCPQGVKPLVELAAERLLIKDN